MGYSGKLELETLGKLLLLSAFFVVGILIFWGVMNSFEEGQEGFGDYVCFASNLLKHNVMKSFPSGCSEGRSGVIFTIKDKENFKVEEQVAGLIDKCWWMYGSGKWDLGAKGETELGILAKNVFGGFLRVDYTYACHAFSLNRKINVKSLYDYMKTHKRDGRETNAEDSESYWNYIQKNAMGEGIGVDMKLEGELKKDKVYYIIFLDERHYGAVQGAYTFKDMILISDKADFGDKELTVRSEEEFQKASKKFQDFLDKKVILGE